MEKYILKSLGYGYPSSTMAYLGKFHKDGCYYLRLVEEKGETFIYRKTKKEIKKVADEYDSIPWEQVGGKDNNLLTF